MKPIYQIVDQSSATSLAQAVEHLIKMGWHPVGGVCVATDTLGIPHFYQAMIRS